MGDSCLGVDVRWMCVSCGREIAEGPRVWRMGTRSVGLACARRPLSAITNPAVRNPAPWWYVRRTSDRVLPNT